MFWYRWKHPIKFAVIIALCVLCWFAFSPLTQKAHLGLDLQGGLRALVELEPNDQYPTISSDVQAEELQVLQDRLGGIGVSELTFEKVGVNRINIEMPGLKDPEQAIKLISQAAVLEMYPLTQAQVDRAGSDPKFNPYIAAKTNGKAIITGTDIQHATVGSDPGGAIAVDFTLTSDGAKKFYAWTKANIGKPLPIFLDKKMIEAPSIEGAIANSGEIHGGGMTQDSAVLLATELNAGALKVPINIIEVENVGPTLGAIDLQKSLIASLVGLGVVLLFMLVVYRAPGFLADVALVAY
ncbi:MAG: preprotein translocase subunit SecD, partial [Candidatus Eremiobacterales bacterium]